MGTIKLPLVGGYAFRGSKITGNVIMQDGWYGLGEYAFSGSRITFWKTIITESFFRTVKKKTDTVFSVSVFSVSVSAVVLDRRHHGAHTRQKRAVVDRAGGRKIETARVVFPCRLAVALHLRDDRVLVVAHKGKGGGVVGSL